MSEYVSYHLFPCLSLRAYVCIDVFSLSFYSTLSLISPTPTYLHTYIHTYLYLQRAKPVLDFLHELHREQKERKDDKRALVDFRDAMQVRKVVEMYVENVKEGVFDVLVAREEGKGGGKKGQERCRGIAGG